MARRPKIIVLRGNSGSGKSTIAYKLRTVTEPMAIVIEQDHFRQKIVAQKGEESRELTKKLIHMITDTGLRSGRDVIIEGIFTRTRWQDLFEEIIKNYDAETYFFYFDIPLDETMRRHTTRLQRYEFDAEKMREWYKEKDFLEGIKENIIDQSSDLASTLRYIKKKIGYE